MVQPQTLLLGWIGYAIAVQRNYRAASPRLSAALFRRNLVVEGVDLSEWLGKPFIFQGVQFEGSQECTPCVCMDRVLAPGVHTFMKAYFREGLRARILAGGKLRTNQT